MIASMDLRFSEAPARVRISHRHRFVYFSIPKTASEAVRAFLDPVSDQKVRPFPKITERNPYYSHMRPREVRIAFGERGLDMRDYHCFCTVRNPFSRLVSLYLMARRNTRMNLTADFDDWIGQIDPANTDPAAFEVKWYPHGVMTMCDFLRHPDGGALIDRAYRIEDELEGLAEDIRARCAGTDLSEAVLPANIGAGGESWRSFYGSPSTIDRVRALYAEDFERFGYGREL